MGIGHCGSGRTLCYVSIYHVSDAVGVSREKTNNPLYVNVHHYQPEIIQCQRQHTATQSYNGLQVILQGCIQAAH